MLRKSKKVLAMIMVFVIALSLLSGCGKKNSDEKEPSDNKPTTEAKGEPTVIYFGTYSDAEHNPEAIDEVTGEPRMNPEKRYAAQAAMDKVLEELNVKVEWKSFPSNTEREMFLKTVLANDPFCDISVVWAGSPGILLGQNILQKIDDYVDIFSDEDDKWILTDKMYGHYYFLNYELKFMTTLALVYNMSYLEKVDTLKENGKTVMPTDLWKRGDWTWSRFEDYLSKVKKYYENKKAPVRPEMDILPYNTDGRYASYGAIRSNGGSVFGADGFKADSDETKEGVEFIDRLVTENLMKCSPASYPTAEINAFKNGETVFTNMPSASSGGAGQELAKRGEAMGVIPFPRPDDVPQDDPRYQQNSELRDTSVVLKGISKERTKLALEAYRLYCSTSMKVRSNSDKAMDFFKNNAQSEAIRLGFDAANETYGNDIVEAFKAVSPSSPNEFVINSGWIQEWQYNILRDSLLRRENCPKYNIGIEENKSVIMEIMDNIITTTSSDKLVDNILPNILLVGKDIALAQGTDPSKIEWGNYLKATDGIDGDIPVENIVVDVSRVDLTKAAKYDKSLDATVKDAAGNERKSTYNVIVYDPNNKTAPTLTAKAEYRLIKKEEDVSRINWGKDFVETALSAEGYDIKAYVTADVTKLDVTTPGTYDVVLTATDYAGNKTEVKIPVTVSDI